MKLTVNGEPLEIDPAQVRSIEDLLRDRGVDRLPCAVELNRSIVPRQDRADRTLREGDVIEIVTLVGGG